MNHLLTDCDLDIVAGGIWKQCLDGTTAGGGPGLYPDYATCAEPPKSMQEIIAGIVQNVNNIVYGPKGK